LHQGVCCSPGIRGLNIKTHYNKLKLNELVTGDGRALPPRLCNEIAREIMRLASKTRSSWAPCEDRSDRAHARMPLKFTTPSVSAGDFMLASIAVKGGSAAHQRIA
jgi:hypothetical protein